MITDSGNDTERDIQADSQKNESSQLHAVVARSHSRRSRFTAARRAQIIAESFEEDANIAAVARRHGIKASLLYIWRKQAKQRNMAARLFVPVSIGKEGSLALRERSSQTSPAAAIEIEAGGAVVRVPLGVDLKTLQIVLHAVRGA